MTRITVTNDFEGANPHDPTRLERTDEAAFAIRPWSEDGDGNYKFSLLVGVANRSGEPVEADFAIDWADEEYMTCRDYVLLGRRDQWRYFPADVHGPVARAKVVVPPGRWQLALHPTYGLERLKQWQRQAEMSGPIKVRSLGPTGSGRQILAFDIGEPSAGAARTLAVLGRIHPYETAGSFAAEGALRWLLRSAMGDRLRSWRASAVLIANVDGVATGTCKLTAPGGPDMSHNARTTDDAGVAALLGWVEELRPEVMCDFHGWMYHYQDGFNHTDAGLADALTLQLCRSADLDRAWKGHRLTDPTKSDSLWAIAKERHGTESLLFSFGWYGRTVRHMRRIGAGVVSTVLRCR